MSENSKKSQTKPLLKRLDYRWLAVVLFIIAAFAVALYFNSKEYTEDVSQLTNGLDIENGDLNINWERYPTTEIQLIEPLNIAQSGTYHITGFIYNGGITIDAGVGKVRLILDNVIINNPTGPAIYCKNADELVIELIGNSNLSDGDTYASEYDEDVTGVIYSKSDLSIGGDGSLNVNSNYQDAIVSKDDLKFNSGTYIISAKDDAIRGKDSVYIVAGSFTINASSDTIKSTNDTNRNKGFVLIESGLFNLSTTEGKGISATNYIVIKNGNFTINSYDDAIHSDNYVGIINGDLDINSSDDGMHANNKIIIDGGEIAINKAYEGIEAQAITINDGTIGITASDDGINAGGGADKSANNRKGSSPFQVDANCVISINGGDIKVNSLGDGIDSNGYLYFNGGNTIVDGPTNNGNGALDATGGITMSGGKVIAVGSSAMAESLGAQSSIYNASIYLTAIKPANTSIEIKDSKGDSVISHTSAKSFSHISVGTSDFKPGSKYTVYIDGDEYQSFTVTDITTTIGKDRASSLEVPKADDGGEPQPEFDIFYDEPMQNERDAY